MDDLIIYNTDDGEANVSLLAKDGTVWCTQAQMAELFNVQKAAISKHLKNLFEDGEVDKNSVVSILETTAADKVGERSSLCRDDIKKGRFTGKNHGSGGAPSSPWMVAAIRSGFLAAMRRWHGHRRCGSPRMMDHS